MPRSQSSSADRRRRASLGRVATPRARDVLPRRVPPDASRARDLITARVPIAGAALIAVSAPPAKPRSRPGAPKGSGRRPFPSFRCLIALGGGGRGGLSAAHCRPTRARATFIRRSWFPQIRFVTRDSLGASQADRRPSALVAAGLDGTPR